MSGPLVFAVVAVATLALSSSARAESTPADVAPAPRFERVRTHQFGVAGGAAIGQGYTLSVLIASGALIYCAASNDSERGCGMKPSPGAFRELYIPLAGPWLALRRDDVHGDTKYALLFGALGAIQGAGLLLIAYDLLVPRYTVKQVAGVRVHAIADSAGGLLMLDGRF